MKQFVLNVALLFSLWSSVFARPFLALFSRDTAAAQPSPLAIPRSLSLTDNNISSNDPRLPPAVQNICEGGLNATTISSFMPFGPGASLTTGSCEPQVSSSASNNTGYCYVLVLHIYT
jgi:hypothetical protein